MGLSLCVFGLVAILPLYNPPLYVSIPLDRGWDSGTSGFPALFRIPPYGLVPLCVRVVAILPLYRSISGTGELAIDEIHRIHIVTHCLGLSDVSQPLIYPIVSAK